MRHLCLPHTEVDDAFQAIQRLIQRRLVLRPGEYLYRKGDPFRGLFAIRSGSPKSSMPDDRGRDRCTIERGEDLSNPSVAHTPNSSADTLS